MTNIDQDGGGAMRDDLLQRIELMEAMIADAKMSTVRCGWIFVLWGLVDLVAMSWQNFFPHSNFAGFWAWPICLVFGAVATLLGVTLQKRGRVKAKVPAVRCVEGVWGMMGVGLSIYIACAMVRHLTWQYSYLAGILVIVGMAHAISAVILRWRVQGVVAAIWWLGAIAMFFVPPHFVPTEQRAVNAIMFVEMVLCMVVFGLYVMALERRTPKAPMQLQA